MSLERPTGGAGARADGDVDPAELADDATVHAFLNCYAKETGFVEVRETAVGGVAPGEEGLLVASLPEQGVDVLAPLAYRSPTDRHLFETPIHYRLPDGRTHPVDAATLAALVVRDLSLADDGDSEDSVPDVLVERVLRSKRNVETFVDARAGDADRLYGERVSFLDAEQALVFGHHRHPTPKSRQGIAERDRGTYAPELRGSFPLHYVRADPALVESDSAFADSTSADAAAEWIREWLRDDPAVDDEFVAEHVESDDVLLPVHPWQADHLRDQDHVAAHVGDGLEFLGAVGSEFHPTTSVRTLYSERAPFMVKSSLAVTITNSVRTNKQRELRRGVAVAELLDTALGDELDDRFPDFDVVRDPAFVSLDVGDDPESGLETVLRENPFQGAVAENATPVVSLTQDGIDGQSRLGRIVERIAAREGRSTGAVSRDWYRQYLAVSVRPVFWLYLARGLGVEAHQQNSVLSLDDDGYPAAFRYRDNQGFYVPESQVDAVEDHLPGVGERLGTVEADLLTDIAMSYYVVQNNALGVVNALGTAGVADERDLLRVLRDELATARERYDHDDSNVLDLLLESETVPCKANLLTRFRGMDELENDIENQSVYQNVANPLVTEVDG